MCVACQQARTVRCDCNAKPVRQHRDQHRGGACGRAGLCGGLQRGLRSCPVRACVPASGPQSGGPRPGESRHAAAVCLLHAAPRGAAQCRPGPAACDLVRVCQRALFSMRALFHKSIHQITLEQISIKQTLFIRMRRKTAKIKF